MVGFLDVLQSQIAFGFLFSRQTIAQDADSSRAVELAMRQSQLADRYRQLESMLLKMAEYDASNNPRRAALLRQALSKGKERPNRRTDGLVGESLSTRAIAKSC